jgi:hypothetical protein
VYKTQPLREELQKMFWCSNGVHSVLRLWLRTHQSESVFIGHCITYTNNVIFVYVGFLWYLLLTPRWSVVTDIMEWRPTIFRILSPVYCHFNICDTTGPSFRPTLLQHTTRFLVNDQRDAQILFCLFISIYNSLHVSSTSCSSSGETNCFNTASGNSHSMLVAEMCAG